MKKQLSKKLYACLPLGMALIITTISAVMMFSASANAQIIYTDVNPDTSMICSSYPCSKSYNLDLNNDGTNDFTLHTSYNHLTCQFQNFSTTKSVSIFSQSGNLAAANPLPANYSIGSNLSFTTNSVILRTVAIGSGGPGCPVGTTSGSWTSTSDRYLGLQITAGGNTYYGWVRLNVVVDQFVSTVSCTVKDYAYNSIPNQFILAGQTVATGISALSFGEGSGVRLLPNPATNHLTITLGSNNKNVEVTIADITGKIIYSTTASETQKVEVNTADFTTGIYVVKIQSADLIATKKLVIEK